MNWSRRRIKPVIQTTALECGVACLSMISEYHGKRALLDDLSERMKPGRSGTSAKDILENARELGFRANAYKLEPKQLGSLEFPLIIHWGFNHYVVLESWDGKRARIVDPAVGRAVIPAKEFDEKFTGIAFSFTPEIKFGRKSGTGAFHSWKYYLKPFFQHKEVWLAIRGALLLSFGLQIFGVAFPFMTKVFVDFILPFKVTSFMPVLGVGILLLVVIRLLTSYIRSTLFLELQSKFDSLMTAGVFNHLLSLPFSFFQGRNSGDLITRLNSNAWVRNLISNQITSTIVDGFFVILYLVALVMLSPKLGLITLSFGVFQILLILGTSSRVGQLVQDNLVAQSDLQSYQIESLKGIATLKASGTDDKAFEKWNELFIRQLNTNLRKDHFFSVLQNIRASLDILAPLFILWVGAFLVLNGSISLGTMLAFNSLAYSFLAPLVSFAGTVRNLQEAEAHLNRVLKIVKAEPEETVPRTKVDTLQGGIELNQVSFSYSPGDSYVLKSITTSISPGQKIAIVGATGAGKSTLGMLLVGLFFPREGDIRYDEYSIFDLHLKSLREKIGVVLQDPFLFSGSVRQNIAFNDADLPLEDIMRAARKACIHEEIMEMPMGYDTVIAEGGASLSGGQVQRVALARALATNPSILLLDEATSNLDANKESEIEEMLNRLSCTRIHIAHRLSTVLSSDKIIFIDKGEVVSEGAHDELMITCPAYMNLFNKQSILKSIDS